MSQLNPMQLMMMLKQGNPQMVAQQIIKTNFPNDPMMQNLLQMAQNGESVNLKRIAQQMLQSQGRNFDNEMGNLMNMMNNL